MVRPSLSIWLEQCWRDVLQITWNVNATNLAELLPNNKPILLTISCCQQFVLSRDMVHKRPLSAWKQLLHIMNEQDVCHEGEPEYENLYAYLYERTEKVGPEPKDVISFTDGRRVVHGDNPNEGFGRFVQGITMEHLSHVIFGHLDLDMAYPTEDELCAHFEPYDDPQCPNSPCKSSHKRHHHHHRSLRMNNTKTPLI